MLHYGPACVLHHLLQAFFYLFLCKHLPNLKVHPDLFLDFQSKLQTRTRPAYSSFRPKAVLSACVPMSGTRGPGWSLYCRCLLIDLHPREVAPAFSLSAHSCAPAVPNDLSSPSPALLKLATVSGGVITSPVRPAGLDFSPICCMRGEPQERAFLQPSSLAASPE